MDTRVFKIISLFAILFFSLQCSNSKEIEIEELAKVYVDLLVVEDYYNDTDSIEVKKSEVFLKYSIDTGSYYNSFRSIKADSEEWEKFYNFANTYLDTLKANLTTTTLPK